MRIWHVDAAAERVGRGVNGVEYVLWLLAMSEQRLGNQVSVLVHADQGQGPSSTSPPVPTTRSTRQLRRWHSSDMRALRRLPRPDLVHFHSSFIPIHALLSRWLWRRGVPYVVTPHGGVMEPVMSKNRTKKTLYARLVERQHLGRALGVALVSEAERPSLRRTVPGYGGEVRVIHNPVKRDPPSAAWQGGDAPHRVLFLGRFDVRHKGLDILADIAGWAPGLNFCLYGELEGSDDRALRLLRQRAPANLSFHGPVFGAEKAAVLSTARMYVQVSRWEVFGIAVAEAMLAGVPCAVSSSMAIAASVASLDLGLVLSSPARQAATELQQACGDEGLLRRWSERAKRFAEAAFDPDTVAMEYVRLYQSVLDRKQGR